MRVLIAVLVLASLAGSAAAQRRGGRCIGAPPDTTTTGPNTIYRSCDVDRAAKLTKSVRPAFDPDTEHPVPQCVRAEVEFVVGVDGIPETSGAHVVSGNSTVLADAVIAALPGFRYTPAVRDGLPVRQWARFKWSISVSVISSGSAAADPGRAPLC